MLTARSRKVDGALAARLLSSSDAAALDDSEASTAAADAKSGGVASPPGSRRAYALFVYLGVCTGLPWCAVVVALPWLSSQSPDARLAVLLPAIYQWAALPIALAMLVVGSRVPPHARIYASLSCHVLALALLPLAARAAPAVFALCSVLGAADGAFASSVYGVASRLPPSFRQGVNFGVTIAGVAVLAPTVAAKVAMGGAGGDAVAGSAAAGAATFLVTAAAMAVGAGAFALVTRNGFVRWHTEQPEATDSRDAATLNGGASPPVPATLALVRAMRASLATLVIVRIVNFSLWPSFILSSIPFKGGLGSHAAWLARDGWWPLVLSCAYFGVKVVGTAACQPRCLRLVTPRTMFASAVAFCLFIPLFIGCARSASPLLGDATVLGATLALQLTSSTLATLAFMRGPTDAAPAQREAAGFALELTSRLGTIAGTSLASAWVAAAA
jgi:hypothetical protein